MSWTSYPPCLIFGTRSILFGPIWVSEMQVLIFRLFFFTTAS